MIEINFKNNTYICPFCGKAQSFSFNNMEVRNNGYNIQYPERETEVSDICLYHIKCTNQDCQQITVVGFNKNTNKQWDIYPENVYRKYPDYIPQQIRDDYKEACLILDKSPKAAATLLRRCLQGMIHDFWGEKQKNLNAEITAIQSKVSPTLWNALDGLRKLGNIGAHMEADVNLIIDIDIESANKLRKLIELCLEKWYIARHDEEELYDDIVDIANQKEIDRKGIKDEG